MCYFERIDYACGDWKWGNMKEQCPREWRTRETCGAKLSSEVCTSCYARPRIALADYLLAYLQPCLRQDAAFASHLISSLLPSAFDCTLCSICIQSPFPVPCNWHWHLNVVLPFSVTSTACEFSAKVSISSLFSMRADLVISTCTP